MAWNLAGDAAMRVPANQLSDQPSSSSEQRAGGTGLPQLSIQIEKQRALRNMKFNLTVSVLSQIGDSLSTRVKVEPGMKSFLRSLVFVTFWLGTSSAFATDIIIENNQWNSFTPAEYCSCHPISTIYNTDLAFSIAQKISQGLNWPAEGNFGALKPTSLTRVDALPFSSINANQPSFILQEALIVYVTAESIPEPALLLILGMSLLGVSGLIQLSRKHKGKRPAREAQRY